MVDPASSRPGVLERTAGALRRRDASAWALVAANLIPLVGVLLLGWNVAFLVVLYWAENLVIGGFNVLKMAFAPAGNLGELLRKLLVIPFFIVHYGGFCAVHGVFVMMLTGSDGGGGGGADPFAFSGHAWWGPLIFVQLLIGVVASVVKLVGRDLVIPLTALGISHAVSFVQNYVSGGERFRKTASDLLYAPYGRIVVLHVTILAGAVPVMLLKSPLPLLVVLVVLKIVLDLVFHTKHHAPTGESAGSPAPDLP
ncbi:MAG: DUF6498-containing protein [Planctomycetota bacterium]